jgi:signal transduction histidine kinase
MKAVRVQSLLILSIVVTVVSAIVTYLSAAEKKESITLVIHTYKVIQASNRLLSLLKDMEIGHRGYLITADSAFLQPYHEAMLDIDNDMDTLASLVERNPHQFDVLQHQIIPLVTRKKASLEESVTILQQHGKDSASHFASMRTAKATMDSIIALTTTFIEYEQGQLRGRSQDLEQRYVIGDFIRFTSFALIGITSLAAVITITSKERDNKRLLKELQTLNQQLEQKVKERTRELQEANQDLVQLNQEKNHFLAITTHDLKAPLAGISGLLQVMKLDANARSTRDMEYIQLMEETCDNMQRLISELLDLSRIEQGTTHLDIRPVSITKLLREMEDHFRTWARNKNIELVFKNELTAATIFTDHDVLARILDNLLSNAIKFSPSQRTVSIIAKEERNQLRFDVRDQGPGIRPEERDKLFQRFQTLSARPTNGESSSGLGLSIVKDLVGLLKGTVQVESDNGHGSCFIIRIPRSLDEVVA